MKEPVHVDPSPATTAAAAVGNYRQRKIMEMVLERGAVSAQELAREFVVSPITVRRDLQALAGEGLVERTRGGARRRPDAQLESLFESKDRMARREKAAIGRHMAALIPEHETVFLNGGSTTLEVVRHLAGRHLRLITNNAACVGLDLGPGIELILLGGEYRPKSRSLVGALTLAGLQSVFSGITVLGINGVSVGRGFTTTVQPETTVNQAMIANSNGPVIVVADHHKLGAVSNFLTCPLERVDLLVTDWRASTATVETLAAAGLTVERVTSEVGEPVTDGARPGVGRAG
jgi:DeoR family transcriptional regulator, fructose operon transcriptional repressor